MTKCKLDITPHACVVSPLIFEGVDFLHSSPHDDHEQVFDELIDGHKVARGFMDEHRICVVGVD